MIETIVNCSNLTFISNSPATPTYSAILDYYGRQTFEMIVSAAWLFLGYVLFNMFVFRTPKEKQKILKNEKIRDFIITAFDVLALIAAVFIIVLSYYGSEI